MSTQSGSTMVIYKNFCGAESYIDLNQTWYTDVPEFSNCFRKTTLTWGPCFLFWFFLPFHLISVSKSKKPPYRFSALCWAKTISACALILTSGIDLVFWIFRTDAFPVDILDPAVRVLSFFAIAATIQIERKRGRRISPLQFIFWLIYLIAQSFDLYSYILDYLNQNLTHLLPFATFLISMIAVFVSFICHFFVEPESEYKGPGNNNKECPEQSASYPSIFTLSWIDGLVWTGFKRALTSEDLWDLPPKNRSDYIVPLFQRHWQAVIQKTAKINASREAAEVHENGDTKPKENDVKVESGEGKKEKETKKTEPVVARLFPALVKSFGLTFAMGSLMKLIHDIIGFFAPIILKYIIQYTASSNPVWQGVLFAFLLLVSSSIQTILISKYFYINYVISLWVKTALTSAIYRKSLRISSAGKKDTTTGEVVNLMSVDTQKIGDSIPYANLMWSAPFQIMVALYLLWQTLGPSVLSGFFVMVMLIPINISIAAKSRQLQQKQMKQKDQRVKMMNEILQGVKILKLYAWEPSFQELIGNIRKKEIHILKQMGFLATATSFIWSCSPFLVSLVTFATYVLSDPENVLDSEKAFVSLSLFNILNFPLSMMPMMLMNVVQASVALKRIDRFLNREELESKVEVLPSDDQHNSIKNNDGDGEADNVIEIKNGNFQWEPDQDKPTLSDIQLSVKRGSLVAIVGTVGAGKSSLLSAILGELEQKSGNVKIRGSVAYTAQQAWIQNCTLKDNIVFHLPLDEARYRKCIDACALKPDLDILPAGDATEIGEKGINLSGGQKHRVSLARSVYCKADIYLLDDPLSAVDSHVGKHIFNQVIGNDGLLAGKTRLLVTHSITHLPEVDNIVVIKDGRISETGTYKELLAKKGAFAEILVQYLSEELDESPDDVDLDLIQSELGETIGHETLEERIAFMRMKSRDRKASATISNSDEAELSPKNGSKSNLSRTSQENLRNRSAGLSRQASEMPGKEEKKEQTNQKQYEAEKVETGQVSLKVYIYYFINMGLLIFGACIFFFTVSQTFSTLSNVWLSKWSDASRATNKTDKLVELLNLANKTTVVQDNSTIDTSVRDMYLGIYGGIGIGQAITVVIAAYFLYISTLQGARKLHDNVLVNVLRLPMSYFDTTPQGRILNRFGKDIDVLDTVMPLMVRFLITCLLAVGSSFLVIAYTTPIFFGPISIILAVYYMIQRIYVASSRQLKRLESVSRSPIFSHFGETVNGAATIRAYNLEEKFIRQSELIVDQNQKANFPSVTANRWIAIRLETIGNLIVFSAALLAVLGRDSLSPGLVGLSLSYALSITQMLNWLIRMLSEVETNVVAVERLKEYTDLLKEAEWTIEATKPKPEWPTEGKIQFNNYSTRYREGLDLILKRVSFEISGGEKVGIVGRTGAGKSSLMLGLFRIVEAAEGSIFIDGIDISKLGLHQLRNKLTIIPQDPVLFSGSLRMNLDPFNKYTDEQLWNALRLSYLDAFAKTLPQGLEYPIAEGGENLSIGQRQLVCLARALLRKTKILVLDEATAAVDLETDALIQATIKSEFSDCTIMTIAHRINTIMDYDKILVLSQGEKIEFDSPKQLLSNKNSVFYSMCKDAGLA